jgi:hypothetical protein
MEVVVLLVAMVGVALIVIPRLQRRRKAAGRRPPAPKKRASAPVVAAAAVPASSAASWAPPEGPDTDVWEDDLGWEGESEAVVDDSDSAREAWADWRTTALAGPGEPDPSAVPEPEVRELPSVERWRARAEDEDEWVEDDDDGLGWEGENEPPPAPGLWNGNGNGLGASPAPAGWSGGDDGSGFRDWSRSAEPPAVAPESAGAFATASATDVAAPVSTSPSEPELGRSIALDDDEWDPPITRTWGAAASRPTATPAKAASRPAARRVHPVVLVALYAAVGIGLVVLVSTVLLGGSSETPKPASTPEPVRSTATPSATPVQAKATATPKPAATPDPAIAAAAPGDFRRERARAERAHKAALADAVAAGKRAARKAAARKRRQQQRGNTQPRTPVATPTPGSGSNYTPPAYTQPRNTNPKPNPKPACEFCIG